MFENLGPHCCPICSDEILELITKNYSGCSVDICKCPKCNKIFQISYRVDKIIEVEVKDE